MGARSITACMKEYQMRAIHINSHYTKLQQPLDSVSYSTKVSFSRTPAASSFIVLNIVLPLYINANLLKLELVSLREILIRAVSTVSS